MKTIWKLKPQDKNEITKLMLTHTISYLVASVLATRNLMFGAVRFFTPTRLQKADLTTMPDVDTAAKRLWQAYDNKETVVVSGDYDVDGVTSTVVMVRTLKRLKMDVHAFIPNRIEDGYGISPDTIAQCIELHKPSLIVTVDCGTNSVEAVEYSKSQGVDIIITDHHEADFNNLSKPYALVNPKVGNNKEFLPLAGVGVAHALLKHMHNIGQDSHTQLCLSYDPDEYLDIVAVGTVADMVPLVGENRWLVRTGLKVLSDTRCPGLRALMHKLQLPKTISTTHIGFKIGPRINAVGRMGSATLALDLLLSNNAEESKRLVSEIEAINTMRRELSTATFDEASELAGKMFDLKELNSLVVAKAGWHKGIVGIVASRLIEAFGRPTIVLGVTETTAAGSCRSIPGVNLVEALHECKHLLKKYGGHAGAAGVTLDITNLEAFTDAFNTAVNKQLGGEDIRKIVEADCEVTLDMLTENASHDLQVLEPFGMNNPHPLYLIRNLTTKSRRPMSFGIIATLTDGVSEITALMFGDEYKKLKDGCYDIICKFEMNEFRGNRTPQLMIEAIRNAETG